MRLVFIVIGNEGRNGKVNGDTIRTGGVGASGTDQSTILCAEYLAGKGHDVVVAMPKSTVGEVCRGVMYTDMEFTGVAEADREFDVMFTMLWFQEFDKLPIKVRHGLVVVQHMQYVYSHCEISKYVRDNDLALGAIHISDWEMDRTRRDLDSMGRPCMHALIPNPIMTDLAEQVAAEGITRVPHSLVFTAAWNRGAEACKDMFQEHLNEWEDRTLTLNDYTQCTLSWHNDPRIRELGSTDKVSLLRNLARSEYFVYPSVNRGGGMHYDTFGCVVAEALLMGVIPVCYPLGALQEVFGDTLAFMPFPPTLPQYKIDALKVGGLGEVPELFDPAHIAAFVKELDKDEARKAQLREAGRKLVMESYGIDKVGPQWEGFLQQLMATRTGV